MRQGCVLSPRLFCSVLQLAMEEWRCDVSHTGLDVGDGGPPLLDLRFADDILLFAGSAEQLGYMLDKLVTSLEKVGLKLNAAKTKALTTQAQPPKTLKTRAGLEIAVLDQSSSHKWLGCMLSTENAGRRQDDIDHRLQSAARAFHVHKWILCDKMVSMASRLKFFDAMITSVVCFAAGHRKIYTTDLRKLDVHCRKLLRRVVGPPADIDWNQPWHTILHAWHRRIDQKLEYHDHKLFAYLMLGRMEDSLEAMQPEEQHGFRQGRRIEEHRLTANVCLQKTLAASTPLWIISLDLSKAFDKIDWNALWSALRQHGISEHLIWILQCVYYGQTGVVRERDVDSCGFDIRGGVRQGCVLSPRLFSAAMVGRSSRDCISELRKSDLHCRRALRPVVGPPFRVNWTHKVLQIWHCRIKQYTGHNGFNFWFARYVQDHSKFADPVAMKRGRQVFAWNPRMICQRFLMWDECLLDTLIGIFFGV